MGFLDNLKQSLDTGEFNSEAAKAINQLDELANGALHRAKQGSGTVEHNLQSEIAKRGLTAAPTTKAEADEANRRAEAEMKAIKENNVILKVIATLINIEETVYESVKDMTYHIYELEDRFDIENPAHREIFVAIDKVKEKYGSLIERKEVIQNEQSVIFIKTDVDPELTAIGNEGVTEEQGDVQVDGREPENLKE